MADKEQYCNGCRNDHYNHRQTPGFDGSTKCWSLEKANVVTRYRIHWWAPMDTARNFTKVTTLDCHHEPGQYGFLKELPEHLRDEAHLVKA